MEYVTRFVKNIAIATTSSVLYEVAISGFDGKFQKFDAKYIEAEQVGIAAITGAIVGSSISFVTILFDFVTADIGPYSQINKRGKEFEYKYNPIRNWA